MSSHTTSVRYRVSMEGAEEASADVSNLLSSTSRAIGVVTSLDYTFMSFKRTAEDFNIINFTRTVLSTISLIQSLIGITKAAELAQTAYNIALAIGRALAGDIVGVAVGLGVGAGAGISIVEMSRQANARVREGEDRLREEYRSTVP